MRTSPNSTLHFFLVDIQSSSIGFQALSLDFGENDAQRTNICFWSRERKNQVKVREEASRMSIV